MRFSKRLRRCVVKPESASGARNPGGGQIMWVRRWRQSTEHTVLGRKVGAEKNTTTLNVSPNSQYIKPSKKPAWPTSGTLTPRVNKVFRIAKQMMRENQDVMGENCVKYDEGELALTPEAKKAAWKQHYEGLLNVEFPWNPEELSDEPPKAQRCWSPQPWLKKQSVRWN